MRYEGGAPGAVRAPHIDRDTVSSRAHHSLPCAEAARPGEGVQVGATESKPQPERRRVPVDLLDDRIGRSPDRGILMRQRPRRTGRAVDIGGVGGSAHVLAPQDLRHHAPTFMASDLDADLLANHECRSTTIKALHSPILPRDRPDADSGSVPYRQHARAREQGRPSLSAVSGCWQAPTWPRAAANEDAGDDPPGKINGQWGRRSWGRRCRRSSGGRLLAQGRATFGFPRPGSSYVDRDHRQGDCA